MKRYKLYPFFASNIFLSVFFICSALAKAQTGNPIVDAPGLKTAITTFKANRNTANAQKVLDFINANSAIQFDNYKEMADSLRKWKNLISAELDMISLSGTEAIMPSPEIAALVDRAAPQSNFLQGGLIDAAGSFIAQRFKQEMEIAFLDRFRDWLKDGGKVGMALRALFPTTSKVLLQNDPYQYTSFLEMLKEALKKDINNLPANIGAYLSTDPFGLGSNSYYFTALLAYNNIVMITNGKSPIETLGNLNNDPLLSRNPRDVQSVLMLTSVISRLLTNPASTNEWLSVSTIRNNSNSPDIIKVFFGLFMLKYRTELITIKIGAGNNLYNLIATNENKLNAILDWIKEITATYAAVLQTYTEIKDLADEGKEIPGLKITEFENRLVNVFRSFFRFPFDKFGITLDPSIETTFENAAFAIRSFTDLVIYIKEKNYGLALASAIDMITPFLDNRQEECRHILSLVKKYGNFAVSVAKSNNKNEMLDALNTAALPVGSYRIKRNSYSNFSLNAYAGFFGGLQTFSSAVPASVKKSNGLFGFTAPVGLAYSWGHIDKNKKDDSLSGSSSTILLSVIDIGAVTAFRLTKDSTASLPDLKWENLLAPGIFYVYGVKKLPVSCGIGVQYGPQLRHIKDNKAVILPSAWTVRLFVAIDIPVFSFYSRTEKRRKPETK